MECDIKTNIFGDKYYYKKGTYILHREYGPAVEYESGNQSWYFDGVPHRMDGPSLDRKEQKQWWINGERLSPEKEEILNKWWDNKNC